MLQLKNSRKEVANLLRTGKAENARIRVETVMREEAMLQAYDGGPHADHNPCYCLAFLGFVWPCALILPRRLVQSYTDRMHGHACLRAWAHALAKPLLPVLGNACTDTALAVRMCWRPRVGTPCASAR